MVNGNGNGKKKKITVNGNGRKRTRQTIKNSSGYQGITQSVAVSVRTPFNATAAPKLMSSGLDAFNPCHVPLPRAVGGYQVVRSTQPMSFADSVGLFGPMSNNGGSVIKKWSNRFAVTSVNAALPVNAANNSNGTSFQNMTVTGWGSASVTPAAFSVQIMNPEALQTSTGIVYIGRAKQCLAFGGDTTTWGTKAFELVALSNPRLCSAGKLALKGVQGDCIPFNMNELSDFKPIKEDALGAFTWADDTLQFEGMAPIFIYNPNNVALELLVCCEWRVRFDPTNPAYASHQFRQSSELGYWDKLVQYGESMGNGIYDIAEKAAVSAAKAGALEYMRQGNQLFAPAA